MATIKSYTDIEQSKKLAEILPIESADMFYDGVQDTYKEKVYNIPINGSSITVRTGHSITKKAIKANLLLPCWSLAKLLDILKDKIIFGGASDKEWFVSYTTKNPTKVSFIYKSNLVDACVETIEKLHELNLL